MKGKAGLAIGIAIGYVLGTRAGRERYEQIKSQAMKVWNTKPVQDQVDKVKDFAKSSAMALPSTLWETAVKVTKAASGKPTPGQKLDAALKVGKDQADDVAEAAGTTAEAVKDVAEDAIENVTKAARDASKGTAAKPKATGGRSGA